MFNISQRKEKPNTNWKQSKCEYIADMNICSTFHAENSNPTVTQTQSRCEYLFSILC